MAGDIRHEAAAALEAAFAARDRGSSGDLPRVGLFGNGIPEVVIAAVGACPVHLSLDHGGQRHEVDRVVEPFVEPETRIFLNRLLGGEFADYRGIVFARDDAAALTAYQYAREWLRQRPADGVPPLFLWNFIHTDSGPAQAFNRVQGGKLAAFLQGVGLAAPAAGWADAVADEGARRAALARMQALVGRGISGAVAMCWRNAGRFIEAGRHARLIDDALPPQGVQAGRRIGLVGSALGSAAVYEALEETGTIVCDLQPWGAVWPGPEVAMPDLDTLLAGMARNPYSPRIVPPTAHRAALVEALVAAGCEVVVCQLSQHDDSFGWEIPSLAAELEARGIGFINLGFRDHEPDAEWCAAAAARVAGEGVPA